MDFKTGKIIEIVREFLANSENKFEINGVDLSKAVFMYRQKNTSFEPIPKGNYTTKEESNILYLKVEDEIKTKAYEYQIIYTTDMKAGKYLETYPELKVLVAKYNDLVEDVTNIIKYAKTTGVKVDTVKMTQILTPLEPNTFWAMNEKGNIEAYPLGNLNSKYEEMVNTLKKEVEELIKTTKETSISEINSSANLKLSEFTKELEKKNNDLNAIFEQAKESIKKSVDALNTNEANAIKEFERILTERINTLNQVTEDLKNDLANAVARYIEANKERLKGDKGDKGKGITDIQKIGQNSLRIIYGDNNDSVDVKISSVSEDEVKEIIKGVSTNVYWENKPDKLVNQEGIFNLSTNLQGNLCSILGNGQKHLTEWDGNGLKEVETPKYYKYQNKLLYLKNKMKTGNQYWYEKEERGIHQIFEKLFKFEKVWEGNASYVNAPVKLCDLPSDWKVVYIYCGQYYDVNSFNSDIVPIVLNLYNTGKVIYARTHMWGNADISIENNQIKLINYCNVDHFEIYVMKGV